MRIGVNVPDDLLKQMEPIKHMTNLSQVCREAIKDRVDAYERARARADREGMQEVAAQTMAGVLGAGRRLGDGGLRGCQDVGAARLGEGL